MKSFETVLGYMQGLAEAVYVLCVYYFLPHDQCLTVQMGNK